MIVDLDLSTATPSDSDELLVSDTAVSLVSHESPVQTFTELLLRFEEQYAPPVDSTGKAPAIIDHGGVAYGAVFEGCKGYGIHLDGEGGLRVDGYAGTQNVSFTVTAVIRPEFISGKHVIAHKVFDEKMSWSFCISNAELIFEYRALVPDEIVVIHSGQYVYEDTTYTVGLSIDPSLVRFSVNGTVSSRTISIAPYINTSGPLYVGFDGQVNNYIGYMDEFEYRSDATAVFAATTVDLYTKATPYVEIDVPVSSLSLGNINNIEKVKLLYLGIQDSAASTGTFLASVGNYSPGRFLSGREANVGITNTNMVAFDAPQEINEFNRHITRFTQVVTPAFTNEYISLRIYFMSDGRQPLTLTSAKLHFTSLESAVCAGSDKNVLFGSSVRPFSDGGILLGNLWPGQVQMYVDNALFEYPRYDVFSGQNLAAEDIQDNDEFQYVRAITLQADNNLIAPLSASDLIGEGALYKDLSIDLACGSHTEGMVLRVRAPLISVYTRDYKGDTILSTLGDQAPRLTITDENDTVIVSSYYLTGDDEFSLVNGTYTFAIDQVDYADQSFEVIVDGDRDVELLVAPPKLRGTRMTTDANMHVEAFSVSHDLRNIGQASTPRVTFNLTDTDTGLPLTLTGSRVYFMARQKHGAWISLIDRECTISTSDAGVAYVDLTATDTASYGEYVGEVVVVSGESRIVPLSKIYFNIIRGLS